MQFPEIITSFKESQNDSHQHYFETLKSLIHQLLPAHYFNIDWSNQDEVDRVSDHFCRFLPHFYHSPITALPVNVKLSAIYPFRAGAFKFFFEMISRWLVPGTHLNVVMLFAADFKIPALSDQLMTLCDLTIHLESEEEKAEIEKSLPLIRTELALGVLSSFNARRILEQKGISNELKIALVQEYVSDVVKRLPKVFEKEVLLEMQKLFVMSSEMFRQERDCRTLSRIVCLKYLFNKGLKQSVHLNPNKRYLYLRAFKSKIQTLVERKSTLSLMLGMNFLHDSELMEKKHLMQAIHQLFPNARAVENSFFHHRNPSKQFSTLYIDIEKTDGKDFSLDDKLCLQKELPALIEQHIVTLMPLVFMPRNEEEIMRNILILSQQLKFIRDIPQVIISFDGQSKNNLIFTIIWARVLREKTQSIQEQFKKSKTELKYIHDRKKRLGKIRNKYEKEATVFRVKHSKSRFQRRDGTIDLYKARRVLVEELSRILGEFRDFNGGMISKQSELLTEVRQVLGNKILSHELLLDNFFYSLQPAIMQTLLEPKALAELFLMLVDKITKDSHSTQMMIRADPDFVYLLLVANDPFIEEEIMKVAQELKLDSVELAYCYIKVKDIPYLGYIYRSDDPQKQRRFCVGIENVVTLVDKIID